MPNGLLFMHERQVCAAITVPALTGAAVPAGEEGYYNHPTTHWDHRLRGKQCQWLPSSRSFLLRLDGDFVCLSFLKHQLIRERFTTFRLPQRVQFVFNSVATFRDTIDTPHNFQPLRIRVPGQIRPLTFANIIGALQHLFLGGWLRIGFSDYFLPSG